MPKKKPRKDRTTSIKHEKRYYYLGCKRIMGIDEAGRGTWAGPVTAGAVCLPVEREGLKTYLKGVRDSKDMTPNQRLALVETIQTHALTWGIGNASAEEIDEHGIINATLLAMKRALEDAQSKIDFKIDCLFLDDMVMYEVDDIRQVSMIGGDHRSLSIAAASVLAKVSRDTYMIDLATEFPQYGFEAHKGYGTAKHQQALETYGVTPIHRKTFQPVLNVLNKR